MKPMVDRLAEAAKLLRERANSDEFALAVADWMDEERAELEAGDPHFLHESGLRAADAVLAG